MAKIFLDFTNYPALKNAVSGQRLTVTMAGKVQQSRDGVMLEVSSIKVGKNGKLGTQEVLLANRLDRIESKLPGQAVSI